MTPFNKRITNYKQLRELFMEGLVSARFSICSCVVEIIGEDNYPAFIKRLKRENLVHLESRSKNPLDVDVWSVK